MKPTEETEKDPIQENNNKQTNDIFTTIEQTGKIYTDQTGRFPVTSSKGNKYILLLYEYDTNASLTEPIKNRTAPELL